MSTVSVGAIEIRGDGAGASEKLQKSRRFRGKLLRLRGQRPPEPPPGAEEVAATPRRASAVIAPRGSARGRGETSEEPDRNVSAAIKNATRQSKVFPSGKTAPPPERPAELPGRRAVQERPGREEQEQQRERRGAAAIFVVRPRLARRIFEADRSVAPEVSSSVGHAMMPLVEAEIDGGVCAFPRGAAPRGPPSAVVRIASFGLPILCSSRVSAQLTVDQVPTERTVPLREQVEQEMESSRLHARSLSRDSVDLDRQRRLRRQRLPRPQRSRKRPAIGRRRSAPAAEAILPMGSKLYLRLRGDAVVHLVQHAHGLEHVGRRLLRIVPRARATTFPSCAAGGANKGSSILNSETQANVILTTKDASGNFEVDLTHALFLRGRRANTRRTLRARGATDVVDVEKFNRTDLAVLAGLRLRLTPRLDDFRRRSGDAERVRSDLSAAVRDNQTLAVSGRAALRSSRASTSTSPGAIARPARSTIRHFPDYGTTVGSYFISWNVARPARAPGLRPPPSGLQPFRRRPVLHRDPKRGWHPVSHRPPGFT